MTYEKLIKSVSEIVSNDEIIKDNLMMTYTLNKEDHLKLHKEIFYKINPKNSQFVDLEEFEIMISGILLIFKKN